MFFSKKIHYHVRKQVISVDRDTDPKKISDLQEKLDERGYDIFVTLVQIVGLYDVNFTESHSPQKPVSPVKKIN